MRVIVNRSDRKHGDTGTSVFPIWVVKSHHEEQGELQIKNTCVKNQHPNYYGHRHNVAFHTWHSYVGK